MPITLVTGLPGHGKTLWSLVRTKGETDKSPRPVFHNDIPGLTLPWEAHPADKWFTLPPGALMIIDEAQKLFKVRARGGEVPNYVAELETHRHNGLDLLLITQHPTLIDSHVRKLVDRHFHVVRAFGTHNVVIYEWTTGVSDYPEKTKHKTGVVQHRWRFQKQAFEWYKSSELHTVKRRIPAKFWLLVGVLVLMPFLLYLVYWRLWLHHGGNAAAESGTSAVGATPAAIARPPAVAISQLSPHDADAEAARTYLEGFRPRIPGMAFTAPVYDALTRPVEAPYPSVCAFGADFPCRCWSQRGFRLQVPVGICEQLAKEPMDPYWLKRGPRGFQDPNQVERANDAPAVPAGQLSPVAPAPAAPVVQASSQ